MRARWEELGVSTSVTFADAGPRGEGIDQMISLPPTASESENVTTSAVSTWVLV